MYGAWIEGSTDEDIAAIKRAMEAPAAAEEIHGRAALEAPPNPLSDATAKGLGKAKLAKNKDRKSVV